MLLFFSVARSANAGQAERAHPAPTASEGSAAPTVNGIELEKTAEDAGEKMPTDKIVDVSPLALRMSSPFNSSYWLSAA